MALAPMGATAQDRTGVVLEFSGPGGAVIRSAVVRALQDEARLLPQDDAEGAARRLRVDLDDDDGMREVAEDLGVDFFIKGSVAGRGRRTRVTIGIYDRNGDRVARETVRNARGAAGRRRVASATVDALADANLPPSAGRRDDDDDDGDVGDEDRDDDDFGDLDDEDADDEDADDDADDDEPSEPAANPHFRAMAGIGGRTRSAGVNVQDAMGNMAERSYSAGFFPELMLQLDAHPFAGSEGALRNLLARLELATESFTLSSVDEMGQEIDTSAYRFGLDLGYIHDLGSFGLGGLIGFGYDAFTLATNNVMPSTQYTFVRLAPVVRLPIGEDLFYLQGELGFRFGLGVGDLAPYFAQTGSSFGIDLGLSLGGDIADTVAFALQAGINYVALGFEGLPADATASVGIDGSDFRFSIGALMGIQTH